MEKLLLSFLFVLSFQHSLIHAAQDDDEKKAPDHNRSEAKKELEALANLTKLEKYSQLTQELVRMPDWFVRILQKRPLHRDSCEGLYNLIYGDLRPANKDEVIRENGDAITLNNIEEYKDDFNHVIFKEVTHFIGLDLAKRSFVEAKLPFPNFFSARLHKTDFSLADITGGNFCVTYLFYTKFTKANLPKSLFRSTVFYEVDLSGVDLTDADCEGAYFFRCKLPNAHLTRTKLLKATLIECDLTRAYLSDANLSYTKLVRCTGLEISLPKANLSNIYMAECDFSKACFRETNLRGATFDKVDKVNFTEVDFEGAQLPRSIAHKVRTDGNHRHGGNWEWEPAVILDGAMMDIDTARALHIEKYIISCECMETEKALIKREMPTEIIASIIMFCFCCKPSNKFTIEDDIDDIYSF